MSTLNTKNQQQSLKKLQTDLWEIVQFDTQGKRSSMEDYSSFKAPFTAASEASFLLSVFDGHAGHRCANFLVNSLPAELHRETASSGLGIPSEEIFRKIFKSMDEMWLDSAAVKEPKIEDGSTALCVAVEGNELIVANCGDCRAILCQAGQTVALTRDHRPTDDIEQQRIINQGGTVIGGRLQGQLAVSRAFGNYEFKELEILSSEPEIHHVSLNTDVEYLVVGSDGLYDHFTNEELISFIKNGLMNNSNTTLESIVKELVEEAIDRGSDDNITILVVKFEKAFKKLLKKNAKKQAAAAVSKSPALPANKTNGKTSPYDSTSESPAKSLLKKGHKLLSAKNSFRNLSFAPEALLSSSNPPPKKKSAPTHSDYSIKLSKAPTSPGRIVVEKSPFGKMDFFGSRTPVTISG